MTTAQHINLPQPEPPKIENKSLDENDYTVVQLT